MDRLKRAIASFIRELMPQQSYFGFYIYSVASWDNANQTGDLTPAPGTGMPTLGKCPVRLPGIRVKLKPGQEVLVGFENHDPSRYYIAHLGSLGSGLLPDTWVVDADTLVGLGGAGIADLGVARLTDSVSVTVPPGTFGVAFSPPSTLILNPAPVVVTGTIVSASTKVKSR
jgi:hypothetical protein